MKTYVVAPGQSCFANGRLYVEGEKVPWPEGKAPSRAFVVDPKEQQPKQMPEPAASYREAQKPVEAKPAEKPADVKPAPKGPSK